MDPIPWLDDLAMAVADGRPVDWQADEARLAADLDPDLIAPLRLVERIVRAHRQTTFDIDLESVTVGPAAMGPAPRADDPNDPGLRWGALTIAERIGGGSYGDVYRAHDRRLDRTVALKLLRRRDSAETRRASAVIEEGRLMARVRHPNVVTVYGAERIAGRVGLWMEYLEGQTLADELRIGGPFNESALIEVLQALCGALAAVHEAGLLHHDLKAQNVIRTTDGRIVLTDFGAGRQVMTDETPDSRQLRGTPAYLAPEILNGQPASLQSEVYSLGVLLYYLAIGSFPDRTASSDDLQRQLRDRAALSPLLCALISRCLAPNRDDRFKAMPEVADAVNPPMTNEPTRTRRFITAIRTRAWLWLLPTVIGFSGAAIWSARTPELYRSSAVITVVPSKVPGINATDLDRAPSMAARLPQVKNEILSRTRLERVIRDLDLYAAERRTGIMEDIVGRMRSMIGLSADGPSITVSFTTDNPRQAQRVTERLAALFMDEWTRDRKLLVENTDQFLQTRLSDMRDKLVKAEENLARARRTMAPGASVTPEALELESTKAEYQKLLTLRQQAQTAADIERREIGETFKLVDGARVPEVPIGPARGLVKLVATLSGLAIGLLLVGLSAGKAEHGSSAHAVPT